MNAPATSSLSAIYTMSLEGKSSDVPAYLIEDDKGAVRVHLGPLTFQGNRHDAELNLTISGMELTAVDIESGVVQSHGEMKLALEDGEWVGSASFGSKTFRAALSKKGELPADIPNDQLAHRSQLDFGDVLCSIISTIVNAILSTLEIEIGDTLRPMSVCFPQQSGRGYYLLGHSAPGATFPPVFLNTIYMPFDFGDPRCTEVSSGDRYTFTFELGDYLIPFNDVLSAVRMADNFLHKIGINIDEFADALTKFVDHDGGKRFAFSFLFNTYTRDCGLVFNNDWGVTGEQFEASTVGQILKHALSAMPTVRTVYIYAGENPGDKWTTNSGSFPIFLCNHPFWFVYLFGTANVNYN